MANEPNEKNTTTEDQANETKHEQGTVYVDEKNLDIVLSTKPIGGFRLFMREVRADKVALISLILLAVIIVGIYVGAAIINATMDPMENDLRQRNQPGVITFRNLDDDVLRIREWREARGESDPGWFSGLLGTDSQGRYVAPLLIVSAARSLNIAFAVTALSFIIGLVMGLISGFYGGKTDFFIMRFTDTVMIMPTLMVLIAVITMMENRSALMFILLLTAFTWMGRTRLVRASALQNRNMDYISASKTLGTRNPTIIVREMLPNMVDIVVANFVLTAAGNIGVETGLTILGFGMGMEHPSLGALISNALEPLNMHFFRWTWIPAVILVILIMLCINFVGNALQRVADPRQRLV